jgi:hypothetical protein
LGYTGLEKRSIILWNPGKKGKEETAGWGTLETILSRRDTAQSREVKLQANEALWNSGPPRQAGGFSANSKPATQSLHKILSALRISAVN